MCLDFGFLQCFGGYFLTTMLVEFNDSTTVLLFFEFLTILEHIFNRAVCFVKIPMCK